MEQFFQATINGLMLGGFYAVMVLGFSVIWGVMGVINLAHGEFVMLGAYVAWILNKQYGWDPFIAPIVVIPLFFVFGYFLQKTGGGRAVKGAPPDRGHPGHSGIPRPRLCRVSL